MFTGIIEDLGEVVKREARGGQVRFRFRVKARRKWKRGESVAVNGVCLTAKAVHADGFSADVIGATLKATTLGRLQAGDTVHLERALRYGDRLGGHFISGHVDAVTRIVKIKKDKKNRVWVLRLPAPLKKYVAPKGSVALDGVSLTVQRVKGRDFEVALIPHTLRVTGFGLKKVDSQLNLEIDLLARYSRSKAKRPASKKLSIRTLKQQGF